MHNEQIMRETTMEEELGFSAELVCKAFEMAAKNPQRFLAALGSRGRIEDSDKDAEIG